MSEKMVSQHVSQKLSPYCHGELPEEESRRVAEHLIGCQRCRHEFEEIKPGVKFAELSLGRVVTVVSAAANHCAERCAGR